MPDVHGVRSTRLAIEAAPGRPRIDVRVTGDPSRPGLRPVVTHAEDDRARICLVPDGALLLAGDSVHLEVVVGPGVWLDLVEVAGTVAYPMRGARAWWTVSLDLADDATLVWAGEPFVVAHDADVERRTDVRLGRGARLAVRETLVLGRHGESPGRLRQSWRARSAPGADLLVEDLELDAAALVPGVLGEHRVLGSVVVLGVEMPAGEHPEGRLDLDEGGHVWRRLAGAAHEAVADEAWAAATRRLAAR